MIAIYLIPIYLLFCSLLYKSIIKFLKIIHKGFNSKRIKFLLITIVLLFALLPFINTFIKNGLLKVIITKLSNIWIGIMLYSVIILAILLIVINLLKLSLKENLDKIYNKKTFFITSTICIIFILLVNILGNVNAKNIKTTNYVVSVDKSGNNLENLNIMLIADLHLGYSINENNIKQMVEKSNECNPDVIVIAGDIFDNNYDAIKNPNKIIDLLKNLKSKYGVYACYGNHDVNEKILLGFTFDEHSSKNIDKRMLQFLDDANIKILEDEYVLIDNSFYLYGRPDFYKNRFVDKKRKIPNDIIKELDTKKPIFVIDHEPRELKELANAGIDIDLSGHTHDGQFFPVNLFIKLTFENTYGITKKDNMYSIVTSGVGVYGPYIRVGTKSEICNITVKFNN